MDQLKIIDDDLKEALKSRNENVVSVLRILKSSIKNLEIEKRHPLDEPEILNVIEKQAKQRQDSIEQYRNGNREDLAKKEEEELTIIKKYLPEKLDPKATGILVDQVIKDLGASSMKDMGSVMKEVISRANGKTDGKIVSELVKEKLS